MSEKPNRTTLRLKRRIAMPDVTDAIAARLAELETSERENGFAVTVFSDVIATARHLALNTDAKSAMVLWAKITKEGQDAIRSVIRAKKAVAS